MRAQHAEQEPPDANPGTSRAEPTSGRNANNPMPQSESGTSTHTNSTLKKLIEQVQKANGRDTVKANAALYEVEKLLTSPAKRRELS